VRIGDPVLGIDIKAGQGWILSDEMFELLGANCRFARLKRRKICTQ